MPKSIRLRRISNNANKFSRSLRFRLKGFYCIAKPQHCKSYQNGNFAGLPPSQDGRALIFFFCFCHVDGVCPDSDEAPPWINKIFYMCRFKSTGIPSIAQKRIRTDYSLWSAFMEYCNTFLPGCYSCFRGANSAFFPRFWNLFTTFILNNSSHHFLNIVAVALIIRIQKRYIMKTFCGRRPRRQRRFGRGI